ncbi:lipoprotein [Stenotrophomonas sp.]|jgi:predicted small lipoprotein YifL|uniref:LPS translocon maturation chaperone LptM n=1 Tax=Stenotrophomonas sp. TaxID=69392 RepID=UPI0028A22459|nr:lipoprotein [Stenotrophomonas sp.]
MSIPHRNRILIPLAAASLLLLAACGNKGPLVLPQKPVPVEEVAEPATDATTPPADDSNAPPVVPDPVDAPLKSEDGNE